MNSIKKTARKSAKFIVETVNSAYTKSARKRLKNQDFTLLCSACLGGFIYHRLGKQFTSPTINLWLTQGDFIKFVCNLKYYVSLKLEFIETEEVTPVARLGDLTVHFPHSNSKEQAESEWERRKKRINYDNLYIILFDRDNYTLEELREVEKAECKNLALLTSKKLDLDYAYYIKPKKGLDQQGYIDMNIFQIRRYERHWDYIGWLNSERKKS